MHLSMRASTPDLTRARATLNVLRCLKKRSQRIEMTYHQEAVCGRFGVHVSINSKDLTCVSSPHTSALKMS